MAGMRKLTLLGALLALFALGLSALVACGGDDDDDAAPFPGSDDQSSSGDDDDDGTSDDQDSDDDDGDSDGFDFGTGTASVTIGDKTYEFDLSTDFVVCRDVFGAIQAAGPSVDGDDVTFDAWIPPTDWESYSDNRYDAPNISVEDDVNNVKWVADPGRSEILENFPEESRIDSYDKDGLKASGTATFVDEYALLRGDAPESVQGTFEIACKE